LTPAVFFAGVDPDDFVVNTVDLDLKTCAIGVGLMRHLTDGDEDDDS
jgi:hypothetical protein